MTFMTKKKAKVRVDGSVLISAEDRSISISDSTFAITNEYGNSVSYEINPHSFDMLWSQLWQFVKDSQH